MKKALCELLLASAICAEGQTAISNSAVQKISVDGHLPSIFGNVAAGMTDKNYVLDGTHYATIAAAMAALHAASPTGGVVDIPCGTYVGPPASAFFSGIRLISSCPGIPQAQLASVGGIADYGPMNLTILQYATGLNLSSLGNITIDGITLDMTGGSANVVLNAVSSSSFHDLSVVNCAGTEPCLTIQGGLGNGTTSSAANSSFDHFTGRTYLQGGSWGLDMTSIGRAANTTFASENVFDDLIVAFPAIGGILFDKWCDSNLLSRVSLFYYGADIDGIEFNGSGNAAQGVMWEQIGEYDETGNVAHSGSHPLIFNNSLGNYVKTAHTGGGAIGGSYLTANTWIDSNTFQNASGPSMSIYNVNAATASIGALAVSGATTLNGALNINGNGIAAGNTSIFKASVAGNPSAYFQPHDNLSTNKNTYWTNAAATSIVAQVNDDGSASFLSLSAPRASVGSLAVSGITTLSGALNINGLVASGAKFSVAGCGTPTNLAGGSLAGKFTASTSACTPVITTNLTAPNGYSCWMNDRTTPSVAFVETASTTATVTFTAKGALGGTDTLDFGCLEF